MRVAAPAFRRASWCSPPARAPVPRVCAATHTAAAGMSSPLQVHQFTALSDNYGYLLHERGTGATAAVDTPDAACIEAALRETGWTLTHILNTHHHSDHVGGNLALKQRYPGCTVVGPAADAERIPGIDVAAEGGSTHKLGDVPFTVLHVPGHTRGHCAYHFPSVGCAFVGDTLFSLGCGRMFEGTPAQFWDSLTALCALPDETLVYCAHEYTESNAKFAVTLEPGNAALQQRVAEIAALRSQGKPTVPTSLALEKATNPFLRPHSVELRQSLGLGPEVPAVDVWAETRRRKDNFGGIATVIVNKVANLLYR